MNKSQKMSSQTKRKASSQIQPASKRIRHPHLTEFAESYSHPPWHNPQTYDGGYGALSRGSGPLKSGMSPIHNGPFMTEEEWDEYQIMEFYQIDRFKGFTVKELESLEAYAPTSKRKIEPRHQKIDAMPIHPVLLKTHWTNPLPGHLPPIPLGNGHRGYWSASNPIVWDLMLPCLKICTLAWANAETWPFWDALLAGDFEVIEDNELEPAIASPHGLPVSASPPPPPAPEFFEEGEIPPEPLEEGEILPEPAPPPGFGPRPKTVNLSSNPYGHLRFRARPAHLVQPLETKERVQALFAAFADRFEFRLVDAECNTVTGIQDPNSLKLGECRINENKDGKGWINMSYQSLEPLLDPRITDAERMLARFNFATTLIHESAHGFWRIICADMSKKIGVDHLRGLNEPFWEDECFPELGHSVMNAIFGGVLQAFVVGNDMSALGLPLGGIHRYPWMNARCRELGVDKRELIKKPPNFYVTSYHPIPLFYFFDLNDTDFWSASISKYGSKALHMPLIMCNEADTKADPHLWKKTDRHISLDELRAQMLPIDPSAPLQSQTSAKLENERRIHAAHLMNAIHATRAQQFALEADAIQRLAIEAKQYRAQSPTSPDAAKRPPYYRPMISEERYEEIAKYLCDNYYELGIDTMYFNMNEHVFLGYINAQKNFNITPREWRAFLQECMRKRKLKYFQWGEFGFPPVGTRGVIAKIAAGWPDPPPAKKKLAPRLAPHPDILTWFDVATEDIMAHIAARAGVKQPIDEVRQFFKDFDREEFRAMLNRREMLVDEGERMEWKIGRETFERVVEYWDRRGEKWSWGPKGAGIIRQREK